MVKAIDKLKKLKAPIYAADVDAAHHYNAFVEKAEVVKTLSVPVREIDNKHHFNEFEKALDR